VLFSALGFALLGFLGLWFWELVFWLILGPLAITSLYVGWRLWRPSGAATRAVIYWAASVAWVLVIVLVLFKDVALVAGLVAALLAGGVIRWLYVFVRDF
jgi:hypothetical protein